LYKKTRILKTSKHVVEAEKLESVEQNPEFDVNLNELRQKPISEFTALQLMPKGFPITHFDMYGAEKMGLHKFDILSQRGLGHIRNTVEYIRINKERIKDYLSNHSYKKHVAYFRTGSESYEALKQACDELGIEITNALPEGAKVTSKEGLDNLKRVLNDIS